MTTAYSQSLKQKSGLKRFGMANALCLGMEDQRDPETYAIIGAAMAVHRELGHGFLEAVYRAALPIEFEKRRIVFRAEVPLAITYKEVMLPVIYKVDFICSNDVVVEVKALDTLTNRETSQLLHYLKAAGIRRGLLLNFGAESLQYKRHVWG
jgi:GxxExxY protein